MENITHKYENKEIYACATVKKEITQRNVIEFYNSLDKYK